MTTPQAAPRSIDLHALLARAAAHLQQGWCQGDLACDAEGHSCGPSAADAVAWCATGALYEAFAALYDFDMAEDALVVTTPHHHNCVEAYWRVEGVLLTTIPALADTPDGLTPGLAADRPLMGWDNLVAFNDHAEQTQERICVLFAQAAAQLA